MSVLKLPLSHKRRVVVFVVIGLGLYLFSFGPICGFCLSKNQPTPEPFRSLYLPLSSHIGNRGLFAFPLVIYLSVWERLFGGH